MPASIRPFCSSALLTRSIHRPTPTSRLHTVTRQFSRTPAAMAPRRDSLAIIAGVGPGTGASVALKFAEHYHVILLARSPANYEPVVSQITSAGGHATGIATDVSSSASVAAAFEQIRRAGDRVAAAVFNVGGKFVRKPFLDLTEPEFEAGWAANGRGAFHFAQAALPLLLRAAEPVGEPSAPPAHPPTLIFTGATGSLRGGAQLAAFATGKFALRALAQSLGREFGPRGVHVAHVIVDGIIDTPATKAWGVKGEDGKIGPGAIADQYWYLHTQPRSMFTHELDIRPWIEKW